MINVNIKVSYVCVIMGETCVPGVCNGSGLKIVAIDVSAVAVAG